MRKDGILVIQPLSMHFQPICRPNSAYKETNFHEFGANQDGGATKPTKLQRTVHPKMICVIIYTLSCCSEPVWPSFVHEKQGENVNLLYCSFHTTSDCICQTPKGQKKKDKCTIQITHNSCTACQILWSIKKKKKKGNQHNKNSSQKFSITMVWYFWWNRLTKSYLLN